MSLKKTFAYTKKSVYIQYLSMFQYIRSGKKYQKLVLTYISREIERSKNSVAEKIDTEKI